MAAISAPPAEVLIEDAYRQILLRLPADQPKLLYRFRAVYPAWLRLLTDEAFLDTYREFHRLHHVIGFMCDGGAVGKVVATFVTTADTSFSPCVPENGIRLHMLDSRHGRVMFKKLGEGLFGGNLPPLFGTPSQTFTRSY